MNEDDEDTQYMQAQDPGYLLHMMKEAEAYYKEQKAKEREEMRKERAYFEDWNDHHGVGGDEND